MNKASIVPKALLILAALWVGISTKAANQNYDFEENRHLLQHPLRSRKDL